MSSAAGSEEREGEGGAPPAEAAPVAAVLPLHEDEAPAWRDVEHSRPWMGEFLHALSLIPNVTAACRAARISRQSAYHWRAADTGFAESWERAWNDALDNMEREVHRRGMVGYEKVIRRTKIKRDRDGHVLEEEVIESTVFEVDGNLLLAYLRAHRPDRWSPPKQIHHAGTDGGPIEVSHTERVKEASDQFEAEVVRLSTRRPKAESDEAVGSGGRA